MLLEHARVELDFPEVLKTLWGLPLKEVVQQCNTILTQLDALTITGTRRENVELAVSLHDFLYFVTVGRFHTHSARWNASLYRPVVAALVARNELKKTFLDLVDREITPAPNRQVLPPQQQTPCAPPVIPDCESNSRPPPQPTQQALSINQLHSPNFRAGGPRSGNGNAGD